MVTFLILICDYVLHFLDFALQRTGGNISKSYSRSRNTEQNGEKYFPKKCRIGIAIHGKNMNKRILVTGASGFIGRAVGSAFRKNRWSVLGITRKKPEDNICDIEQSDFHPAGIALICKEFKPDIVFHGAGSARVHLSLKKPHIDFNSSVILTQSVLEGIRLSGFTPRFFYASSAAVYGDPLSLPISESARCLPLSPYAYHRLQCEYICREYANLYKIPITVTRIFSLLGPEQRRLLIWELYQQFIGYSEVTLRGTGNEARDYLHIDDYTDILVDLCSKKLPHFEIINVSSGKRFNIKSIVTLMQMYFNSDKPVHYSDSTPEGDPVEWQADISKLSGILGRPIAFDFEKRLFSCLKFWDTVSAIDTSNSRQN